MPRVHKLSADANRAMEAIRLAQCQANIPSHEWVPLSSTHLSPGSSVLGELIRKGAVTIRPEGPWYIRVKHTYIERTVERGNPDSSFDRMDDHR